MTSFLPVCAPVSSRPEVAEESIEAWRHRKAPCDNQLSALFVLGSDATEVADLLVPWEVMSVSRAMELRTVGTSGRLMPLTGKVFSVADFVIGDPNRAPPERCDVVVVPAVLPNDPKLVEWVKKQAEGGSWVLSICEGARLVANTGLLDGGTATTHFYCLEELRKKHKEVSFVHGHRYVVSQKVISSAGVTAGLDATLYLLEQLLGRKEAETTAAALKYEWNEEDDPLGEITERESSFSISGSEAAKLVWRAATPFKHKLRVGVGVYSGVSEVALAAVLDCLPRTGGVKLKTFGFSNEVEAVDTRHGFMIVPKKTFDEVRSKLDLIIIPSVEDGHAGCLDTVMEGIESQMTLKEVEVVRTLGGDSVGKAFFAALDASKELIGDAPAALAAKMVECSWDP